MQLVGLAVRVAGRAVAGDVQFRPTGRGSPRGTPRSSPRRPLRRCARARTTLGAPNLEQALVLAVERPRVAGIDQLERRKVRVRWRGESPPARWSGPGTTMRHRCSRRALGVPEAHRSLSAATWAGTKRAPAARRHRSPASGVLPGHGTTSPCRCPADAGADQKRRRRRPRPRRSLRLPCEAWSSTSLAEHAETSSPAPHGNSAKSGIFR